MGGEVISEEHLFFYHPLINQTINLSIKKSTDDAVKNFHPFLSKKKHNNLNIALDLTI